MANLSTETFQLLELLVVSTLSSKVCSRVVFPNKTSESESDSLISFNLTSSLFKSICSIFPAKFLISNLLCILMALSSYFIKMFFKSIVLISILGRSEDCSTLVLVIPKSEAFTESWEVMTAHCLISAVNPSIFTFGIPKDILFVKSNFETRVSNLFKYIFADVPMTSSL